jgi:CRISPR-associated protein Csb3
MKYDIQINPYNPVEYLACCGVLEVVARFDTDAVSWWELDSQPRCWLASRVDEAALLQCLTQTLADWSAWQTSANVAPEPAEQDDEESPDETDETVEESNEGLLLSPTFHLNDQTATLRLDWWYETLKTDKTIKEKSAWKMYAGQQTAEKISRDMTGEAAKLLQQNHVASLSALLKLSAGMTGRFGFDPRSSRNALDTGFSANDLNLPIATYLFAEMLAALGAHYFFAHRTRQGGGITSARGWIEDDVFQYALWETPLPITLARLAATGAAIRQDTLIPLRAGRARRDKYANFKMATTGVWPEKPSRPAKK